MVDDKIKAPRGFEPPPWEREQFDELARRRQAEADAEAAALAASLERREAPGAPPGPEPETAAADTTAPEPEAPEPVVRKTAVPPDEAQVDVMMMGLKAQEPEALAGAWVVPMAAGAVIVLVGLVLGVFGVIGLVSAGKGPPSQSMVSGVILMAALAMIGLGGWLLWKSLKTRSA